MELFSQTGGLMRDLDCLLEKLKGADNALTRSLLQSDILNKQEQCKKLLTNLKVLYGGTLQELKLLDDAWTTQAQKDAVPLQRLYQKMSYLMRWIDQLEERLFQLSA
jgi:hypothetical protein